MKRLSEYPKIFHFPAEFKMYIIIMEKYCMNIRIYFFAKLYKISLTAIMFATFHIIYSTILFRFCCCRDEVYPGVAVLITEHWHGYSVNYERTRDDCLLRVIAYFHLLTQIYFF